VDGKTAWEHEQTWVLSAKSTRSVYSFLIRLVAAVKWSIHSLLMFGWESRKDRRTTHNRGILFQDVRMSG
jgi:hypothetical protein